MAEELSLADVPSEATPGSRGACVYVRGRLGSRGSKGFTAGFASIHRVDFRGASVGRGTSVCGVGGAWASAAPAGLSAVPGVAFGGPPVDRGIVAGGAFGACFLTGGGERGEGVPWPRLGARVGPDLAGPTGCCDGAGLPNCGAGDGARSCAGPRPDDVGFAGTGSPRVQP